MSNGNGSPCLKSLVMRSWAASLAVYIVPEISTLSPALSDLAVSLSIGAVIIFYKFEYSLLLIEYAMCGISML